MSWTKRKFVASFLITAFAVTAVSGPVFAAPEDPRAQRAKRYRKPASNSDVEAGCAHITVNAPIDVVRKVVMDYGDYSKFIKRYKNNELQFQMKTKLVGREGDKHDVYMEVPVMKGTAKFWGIVRFEPPKTVGTDEVIEGRLVKGNVKRLDARWRLRKIDDNNTRVDVELLIIPKLPLPGSLITGELEFVSDVSVTGARDESQRRAAAK
jgi:ribosome-associated toxin RatA of RatAB toxin-antitoxin module